MSNDTTMIEEEKKAVSATVSLLVDRMVSSGLYTNEQVHLEVHNLLLNELDSLKTNEQLS